MKRLIGGSGSGGGTPGGSDTQIQFNDAGVFGGDVDLTWNKTAKVMTVAGDVNLSDGGTYTTTLQTVTPTQNRTISFPDATGTVALVAGSSGQPIYNNAGAYAGLSTATIGATGNITLSLNGAASTPPVSFTGTWFTGGTGTTTKPQLLIEPSGTTSTAWSTSGTGLGVNAASGFAGNLLDLQVNGTSQASITSAGRLRLKSGGSFSQTNVDIGNTDSNGLLLYGTGSSSRFGVVLNGTSYLFFSPGELQLASSALNFRAGFAGQGASDVGVERSTSGVLKVTNGSTGDGTISGQLRAVGTAPANATATGTAGDIRYDADYIYVCTATNTWKRAALATW